MKDIQFYENFLSGERFIKHTIIFAPFHTYNALDAEARLCDRLKGLVFDFVDD